MNDIKLAMLGNREAAKRLTDAGLLVPCPMCGGEVRLRRVSSSYTTSPTTIMDKWTVECPNGWKVSDPKTRPFKFSNEMEDWEYHG